MKWPDEPVFVTPTDERALKERAAASIKAFTAGKLGLLISMPSSEDLRAETADFITRETARRARILVGKEEAVLSKWSIDPNVIVTTARKIIRHGESWRFVMTARCRDGSTISETVEL